MQNKYEVLRNAVYSPEEAGDLMGVSKYTIVRMIEIEDLPAKKIRGRWRILGKDILDYVKDAEEAK